ARAPGKGKPGRVEAEHHLHADQQERRTENGREAGRDRRRHAVGQREDQHQQTEGAQAERREQIFQRDAVVRLALAEFADNLADRPVLAAAHAWPRPWSGSSGTSSTSASITSLRVTLTAKLGSAAGGALAGRMPNCASRRTRGSRRALTDRLKLSNCSVAVCRPLPTFSARVSAVAVDSIRAVTASTIFSRFSAWRPLSICRRDTAMIAASADGPATTMSHSAARRSKSGSAMRSFSTAASFGSIIAVMLRRRAPPRLVSR